MKVLDCSILIVASCVPYLGWVSRDTLHISDGKKLETCMYFVYLVHDTS